MSTSTGVTFRCDMLAGQVALVVGGSSGIGAAIATAADGIRVNANAPGWVRTALTRDLQDDPGRDAAIVARTPLGRWAEPAEIAGAAVFLCSPAAGFITGALLPVDGGYLAA